MRKRSTFSPTRRASSTSASVVSSLRRKQSIPSRSARRYAAAGSGPCSTAAFTAMQAGYVLVSGPSVHSRGSIGMPLWAATSSQWLTRPW